MAQECVSYISMDTIHVQVHNSTYVCMYVCNVRSITGIIDGVFIITFNRLNMTLKKC